MSTYEGFSTSPWRHAVAMAASNGDAAFAEWYDAFYAASAVPPVNWRHLMTHFDNTPGLRACWERVANDG